MALDVALKARERIVGDPAIEVRLTRDMSVDLARPFSQSADLRARTDMANTWPADLYISLHCNSDSNPVAHGIETYVYDLAPPTTADIARSLHEVLVPLCLADRGLRRKNLHVLRETRMPAMLIELGFLTNPQDRALLADPAWRTRVAEAIAGWVRRRYGSEHPSRSESATSVGAPGPQAAAPDPWAQAAWAKAVARGVVDGTRPRDPLTRQELAVVLERLGLL